jgi:hypothetical protein
VTRQADSQHAKVSGVTTSSTELQQIPGVGPSIAQDLLDLGVRQVADLNGADPEELYERLCTLRGEHIDRCVLYVFRCAVYFASHEAHDPQRLKWWSWKDRADSAT